MQTAATRNRSLVFAVLATVQGAACTCGTFDPAKTRFACTTDADCAAGFSCGPVADGRECVKGGVANPAANGASCMGAAECSSGFCVGGLCCSAACSGECESCAVVGSKGRCVALAQGTTCRTNYSCDGATGVCPSTCGDVAQCAAARDCVGGACVDLDECQSPGLCGVNTVCTNTPGSWECSCKAGFSGVTVTGGAASCVDVDECLAGPDCGPLAVCANTPGSYECRCPSGTFGATITGAPTSCSNVDHCVGVVTCGANARCSSTSSSYTCNCQSGYAGPTTTGGPATCSDVNECTTVGTCGPNADCTNTIGSYQCACRSGFTGSATMGTAATCVDVNECGFSTTSCGSNAHCTNTPGSWQCSCDVGFSGAPVTGGPASCTGINRCLGVSCGANAACTNTATSYTCACNSGYQGAQITGGPASCADIDECAAANACGANAICVNSPGSYGCTCASGFSGPATMGMPTTCVAGLPVLGAQQGNAPLVIPLTQTVPIGTKVAVAYVAAQVGVAISDSRANTWTRVVSDSNCGACGSAGLFTSTLANGWGPGDTVTVTGFGSVGAWVTSLGSYVFLDAVGTVSTSVNTTTPSASTPTAVFDPNELLIGAFSARIPTTLVADGGYTTELVADAGVWGIIASNVASGLSGVQTFSVSANPPQRFSGFLATFYGGAQAAPTGLSLVHTANNRSFTVGWTGGRGNGGAAGCAVQFLSSLAVWTTMSLVNCDATTSARIVNLPGTVNWYGSAWSMVPVRLLRVSDSMVVGTFPTSLTCLGRPASTTPTPTIDENCDSTWDDHTCASFGWVQGMVYAATFTACTNSGDVTASKGCAALNEAESRYTDGMSTLLSPAGAWSSISVGTACTGSFTGAVSWTCTGSSCSYR